MMGHKKLVKEGKIVRVDGKQDGYWKNFVNLGKNSDFADGAEKNLNCSQIIDRLNELIKKSFSSDDKKPATCFKIIGFWCIKIFFQIHIS